MFLRRLRDGAWKILAIDDGRSDNLETFLVDCERATDVDQLEALFDEIENGNLNPRMLPKKKCHHVAEKIWQLTQRKVRILWFYDKDHTIIVCLAFIKMTDKTPNAKKKRAIALRNQYFEEKQAAAN